MLRKKSQERIKYGRRYEKRKTKKCETKRKKLKDEEN
jgi:hypothetical protein